MQSIIGIDDSNHVSRLFRIYFISLSLILMPTVFYRWYSFHLFLDYFFFYKLVVSQERQLKRTRVACECSRHSIRNCNTWRIRRSKLHARSIASIRYARPQRREHRTKWTHRRSVFVPVQQLPETPDLPSSAVELLLGLQPRLRLPALQGGRRPLCETALGLLHPRAVSALQPVAVTIRELSEPPPYAHDRGRLVPSLLQVDLLVPDDRALESTPSRHV